MRPHLLDRLAISCWSQKHEEGSVLEGNSNNLTIISHSEDIWNSSFVKAEHRRGHCLHWPGRARQCCTFRHWFCWKAPDEFHFQHFSTKLISSYAFPLQDDARWLHATHESFGCRPAASLDESASEISAMQLRSQNSQAAQSAQALIEQFPTFGLRTQLLFAREFLNDAPVSEKSQYFNMHRRIGIGIV